jgi:hypothetical protein
MKIKITIEIDCIPIYCHKCRFIIPASYPSSEYPRCGLLDKEIIPVEGGGYFRHKGCLATEICK